MADIGWSDVNIVAPELATVNTDLQELILSYVNTQMNVAAIGDNAKLKLIKIYLAAHMATISGQSGVGVAGPVVSEEVGGLKRTYALLQSSTGTPSGSVYGDMYRMLIRVSGARVPITI